LTGCPGDANSSKEDPLKSNSRTLGQASSRIVEPGHRECPECPYLRIFKSTVYVRNHDHSLKFYVDQLGFSVVAYERFDFEGRWVAIAPPDGSAILALVAPRPGSENAKLIGRNTQVGFLAEDINAFDASGEEFGEQRLVEALKQHTTKPAKHTLSSVVEQIQTFNLSEQHDDITLIVAKCTANNLRGAKK
jgi:stage II sporulation SpoE-like protein/glyoxalase/bleomycin resistance protein/dioxygenase superfamily protein